MPSTLTTLRRAARARDQSEHRYRDALIAARAAGETYADIGLAAGVSKQAVQQLLRVALETGGTPTTERKT